MVAVVDAVHMAMTSKVVELTPVNEYQAAELEKHDITERDPMFVTMATMLGAPRNQST